MVRHRVLRGIKVFCLSFIRLLILQNVQVLRGCFDRLAKKRFFKNNNSIYQFRMEGGEKISGKSQQKTMAEGEMFKT